MIFQPYFFKPLQTYKKNLYCNVQIVHLFFVPAVKYVLTLILIILTFPSYPLKFPQMLIDENTN